MIRIKSSLPMKSISINQLSMEEVVLIQYSAAAAALLFTLLILRRTFFGGARNGTKNLPPTVPFALPIIGHMHLVSDPLHQTLNKFHAKYGPILHLRLGTRQVLAVSSTAAAEECFTKNDIVFANRPTNIYAAKHLSYDYTTLLTAPYGPLWRDLRRFSATELFSTGRTAQLSSIREGEVGAMVRDLVRSPGFVDADGYRRQDLMMLMREVVSNMFTQMVVGKRYLGDSRTVGDEEGKKFDELMAEAIELSGQLSMEDLLPALKYLGINKFKKRMETVDREFDVVLQALLDKRRGQLLDMSSSSEEDDERKRTLLDIMIELQGKDPQYYTDTLIKGTMLIFIIGGTDPPANNMEWQLSLLLKHPQVLKNVRHEIDTHVGSDRLITDSDIPKLPLLTNVIKESLRLYPAGPLLVPHESSADCTVAGYDIPRGTILLVNALGIQRDPTSWEDPDSFKPERWFEVDGEGKSFKFLPFGYGRRICPAEFMSMRLMALVTGSLVQCFDWTTVDGEEVDLTEAQGMNLKRSVPLEALYKPREAMLGALSRI